MLRFKELPRSGELGLESEFIVLGDETWPGSDHVCTVKWEEQNYTHAHTRALMRVCIQMVYVITSFKAVTVRKKAGGRDTNVNGSLLRFWKVGTFCSLALNPIFKM